MRGVRPDVFSTKGMLFRNFLYKKQSPVCEPKPNATERVARFLKSYLKILKNLQTKDINIWNYLFLLISGFFSYFPWCNSKGLQGNLCSKLPQLPQKYHNIDCSLICIFTAKCRSTLYTQYCFFQICVLGKINFCITHYQAHNFSCCDRVGQAGIAEFLGHCSPPNTHQLHTPNFSTEHNQNLCASLFLHFQKSGPKESNLFLSGKRSPISMCYPSSIILWKLQHNLISSFKNN